MALWQTLKTALFPSEKKSFLELSSDSPLWENYYFNFINRNNVRISASNPGDAYRYHELVFACVNKISDVMNDAEPVVERLNADGEYEAVKGHPLIALLNKPNSEDVGEDFRKKMVISEQAEGIVYMVMNRSRAGIPVELAVLNPKRVTPRANQERTKVLYYEYTKTNGTIVHIKPEDMLIRRRPDLFNQSAGLAPMAVALKSINSDIGLTTYIDAFFESDGTPSGILKILNRTLSETEKKKLQEQWKEKYGRGGSNQKGLAVLDTNADYQKIGSSLNELDSESVSSRFESRICTVFGVPPILVGAYVGLRWVNQRASAKEALTDFWINKISPELKPLRKWLTYFVLPEFESIEDIRREKVRVGWDISQAAFLQEEVNDIFDRAIKAYNSDLATKNEARGAMGFNPADNGDLFRSEINQANAEARMLLRQTDPLQLPAGDEGGDDEDDPVKKKTKQLKGFEFEGMELSREPTELEKQIDLKAKIEDLEKAAEKLSKLFLTIRKDLITDAARQIEDLGLENLDELNLSVSPTHTKRAEKLLKEIFAVGGAQIIDELNLQGGKSGKKYAAKERDFNIFTLLNLILARITAEIRNRAVNVAVLLYSLEDYARDVLEDRLRDESEKVFEQLARNAANLTIQAGRENELDSSDIELFEYSAILDQNTCSPCSSWDGKQADNLDDLPTCPNGECKGGWNCRCFVIGIAD